MIELTELKKIVEALIFASDSPISENRIKNVITELDTDQIHEIVDELNREYDQHERAFKIVRLAGGYQLVTRSEYANYIKQYYKGRSKSRLSRAALETLAIIAYRQPITRPEIDIIRGVNSDSVLRTLLSVGLIEDVGRALTVGRPILYSTTFEFLQHFGLSGLDELPPLGTELVKESLAGEEEQV